MMLSKNGSRIANSASEGAETAEASVWAGDGDAGALGITAVLGAEETDGDSASAEPQEAAAKRRQTDRIKQSIFFIRSF